MRNAAATRRLMIRLAQKRQRPGTGSGQDFLLRRTTLMQFPDLRPVLDPLPWAVVGAAATRLYMPERVTQDLDVLVRAADAEEVRRRLGAAGYTFKGSLAIGGGMWADPAGFPVDVLQGDAAWCGPALAQARGNRDAHGAPILPLPYLTLMKFEAGRAQDIADITRMLGQAAPDLLTAVRAVFLRWRAPDDAEDLESLIALGRLEMTFTPNAGDNNDV